MVYLVFMAITALLLVNGTSCVQINYISVPPAVQNNSGTSVILDCNYSVRPDDQELVVKWFLNEDVVYQWIPPQEPQSLGLLKDRVDVTHRASDDPKAVYRAIKIINPTTDIAGNYKCFVSTFEDEDFSSKKMIVFEPEQLILLRQSFMKDGMVNFTCFASQVFPQPKLVIYADKKDDIQNKKHIESIEWNVSKHPNGRYSVILISSARTSNLTPGSLINCELRIAGTGYIKRTTLLYYPQDFDNGVGKGTAYKTFVILIQKFTGVRSWDFNIISMLLFVLFLFC